MARQQLYISGVAVDMPAEEIKIKVASNIFTSPDKVKTAFSYNVALPRTMTNDNVFRLAYLPQAETGGTSTHLYLPAALYIDGIPLFSGGKAVLTSVGDKGYNVTLLWGALSGFDTMKEEGLKLNELVNSPRWQDAWTTWTVLAKNSAECEYVSGMDNTVYANLDSDSKALADKLPWTMDGVKATEILATLRAMYDIDTSYSLEFTQRLAKLMHPLVTLDVMSDEDKLHFSIYVSQRELGGHWGLYLPFTSTDGYTNWATNPLPGMQYTSDKYLACNLFNPLSDTDGLAALKDAHCVSMSVEGTAGMPWNFLNFGNNVSDYAAHSTPIGGGLHKIDKTWTDFDWSTNRVSFSITSDTPTSQPLAPEITIRITVDKIDTCEIGDRWCKERNYPAVGTVDYFGEVLAHCGAFIPGSVTNTGFLRVVTYDEVLAAAPQEVDALEVKEIDMTMSDTAQTNRYIHQENDDFDTLVPYEAAGVITVSDPTIDKEREAFKSEFKVPRDYKVELWRVSGSKAEWHASGDYIGGYDLSAGVYHFQNKGQDFATVLTDYYGGISDILRHPKRVAVTVRLTPLELLNFSMERPVRVRQLGRDYLVESLESESGDTYKLTLIQI